MRAVFGRGTKTQITFRGIDGHFGTLHGAGSRASCMGTHMSAVGHRKLLWGTRNNCWARETNVWHAKQLWGTRNNCGAHECQLWGTRHNCGAHGIIVEHAKRMFEAMCGRHQEATVNWTQCMASIRPGGVHLFSIFTYHLGQIFPGRVGQGGWVGRWVGGWVSWWVGGGVVVGRWMGGSDGG